MDIQLGSPHIPHGVHWHFQPVQVGDEVIYLPPQSAGSGRKDKKPMFMRDPGNDWDDTPAEEQGHLPGSDY